VEELAEVVRKLCGRRKVGTEVAVEVVRGVPLQPSLHWLSAFPFHPEKKKPKPLKTRNRLPPPHQRRNSATFVRHADAPSYMITPHGLKVKPTAIHAAARRTTFPLLLLHLFHLHHALALPLQRPPPQNRQNPLPKPPNPPLHTSTTINSTNGFEITRTTSVFATLSITTTTSTLNLPIGKDLTTWRLT